MSSVTIFAENRKTGSRPTANVPVDGKQHTFGELFAGNDLDANAVGVNGDLPKNVKIIFGPPADPDKFTVDNTPEVISQDAPKDIDKWKIKASQN